LNASARVHVLCMQHGVYVEKDGFSRIRIVKMMDMEKEKKKKKDMVHV